jgi:hypothetical protein
MRDPLELKKYPELKALVRAGFPSYKKHKVFVSEFYGININSYWSGGSKDEYAVVELSTLKRMSLPTSTHPYFEVEARGLANKSDQHISIDRVGNITLNVLPPGFALIAAGTFCGKAATAHIYFNPADMVKMLGDGNTSAAPKGWEMV